VVKPLVLLFFFPSLLLCYKTILIHHHTVYALCGPFIGELTNL
jgi:hypothetical protein